MTSQALIFTLCCIGISEVVYLIKKRILMEKPICPVGENCLAVLQSKYSKIFIIPNDVAGLLFYIACSIITALLVIGVESTNLWVNSIKILVAIGSILSIFFTYLQFRVIRAWCFWCLMSACTIWLMGFIILLT
jgi:uncharacterized membrane protein